MTKLTQRLAAAAFAGAAILNNAGCSKSTPLAQVDPAKLSSTDPGVSAFETLKGQLISKGTLAQDYSTANKLKQMAFVAATPEQQSEVIALCAKFSGEGLDLGVAKVVTEAIGIAAGPPRGQRLASDVFVR